MVNLSGRCPLLTSTEGLPDLTDGMELDLAGLEWASPFDLAAIASMCLRAQQAGQGIVVIPPGDPAVLRYLIDSGLPAVIGVQWSTDAPPPVEPPLIPLVRMNHPHDWDDLMTQSWPDIAVRISGNNTHKRVFEILGELVDNAATHGASAMGTLVTAQRYTGATSGLDAGVWLAVVDGGVGIPEHLRRNPQFAEVESDRELLRRSREPWVTGTSEPRGWGLHEVFDRVKEVGSSAITFRSGKATGRFTVAGSGTLRATYADLPAMSSGTWVSVRLPEP